MKHDHQEMIDFALDYLFHEVQSLRPEPKRDDYKLSRSLNYWLCDTINRRVKMFGEITRPELAAMIDTWIMIQSITKTGKKALVLKTEVEPL